MGQIVYYLLLSGAVAPYVREYPWLLGGAVVLFLLRRHLPDPYVYVRTSRRIHQLKLQVAQNPENATARRDLAAIWLQRRRPRRAIPLLLGARERARDSSEIAYLLALAYVRTGAPEMALPLCVEVAEREPKLRYGEIFLVAGTALGELGRHAEAEDALLRFLKINASSVEGWVRLGRSRRLQDDSAGASAALLGAVEAFEQSPTFRRRRQLGWYLRARLRIA